ncbi:MAG: helix-turn-helix domain-containing protein [Acetatifactor sp.]
MAVKLSAEHIVHKTGESPFSIHLTNVAPDEPNALYLHYHPEAEFFYLEEGDIIFTIENHTFHLTSGDAIFIPPGFLHNAVREPPMEHPCIFHAIVFQATPMEALFSHNAPYFRPLQSNRMDCIYVAESKEPSNKKLLAALRSVFDYTDCPPDTCELAVYGTLLICWQELYQLHFKSLIVAENAHALMEELQRVQEYMQAHYAETISLAELAKQAGLSESYLCHQFKKRTGYTPFEYLNRIRMVKSCELLSRTNKKITDIASLCGFNNISYFNRMFTKTVGVTPSAYRKQV